MKCGELVVYDMHRDCGKRDYLRTTLIKSIELLIQIICEKVEPAFGYVVPGSGKIDALDRNVRHSLTSRDAVDLSV